MTTVNETSSGGEVAPSTGGRGLTRPVESSGKGIHSLRLALPHFHSWGSQQWRLMRRALRDGASIEEAAAAGSMSVEEARHLAKLDADRAPLPEAAFTLIYDPAARAAQQAKDSEMTDEYDDDAGEGGGISGEYKRPDAVAALKIFQSEIAPKLAHMSTLKGDLSDPYKRIKDDCHFPRKVLDFAITLDDMEEAKRDHWLLALSLIFRELGLFVPRDLVTMAQGEDGDNVIPIGERRGDDDLVTLTESNDAGEPFEASEEELARQEGRPRRGEEPKPGTGAAARKKMKDSASAETTAALH